MTTTAYLQGTVSLSWARPPWGRTPLKNTESCVSEPEHTLPDGSSLGAPIAGLPALSGTPRPYPTLPTPNLRTIPWQKGCFSAFEQDINHVMVLSFDWDTDQSLKGMHVNSFVADISRTQFLPHIVTIFMQTMEIMFGIIPALIQCKIQPQNNLHYIMKSISPQTCNDILSLLDQGKSCWKIALKTGVHYSTVCKPCSQLCSALPKLTFKAKLHYNMPCHPENQHWEGWHCYPSH